MTTCLMKSLVAELDLWLGDRPFYTLRDLTSIGFFGSMPAARKALKEGRLIFVKISPRRYVIPRSVVLEFLRTNISGNERCASNDSKA